MKRIRTWLKESREKKHVEFDDLDRIIHRCLNKFGHLFPRYRRTTSGSHFVHHFNVPGVNPITIVRPHGGPKSIPHRFAQGIIEGLEDVANYIEVNSEDQSDDNSDDGATSKDDSE